MDVGRARHLYDRHQRHALHAVHDSCAITGCTRPLVKCGHHHRAAHDPGYDLLRHRGHEYRLRRRRR